MFHCYKKIFHKKDLGNKMLLHELKYNKAHSGVKRLH